MNKKAWGVISGISIVTLVTLLQIRTEITEPITTGLPKEYMCKVKIVNFDESGKIKNQITANKWNYLESQNISVIEKPDITVYKPDGTLWEINANLAKAKHKSSSLTDNIESVDFTGNVKIERPAQNQLQPITVTTEQATYYPEKNTIKSSEFVNLSKPGFSLSGKGLNGNLNTNQLELKHDVKTFIH